MKPSELVLPIPHSLPMTRRLVVAVVWLAASCAGFVSAPSHCARARRLSAHSPDDVAAIAKLTDRASVEALFLVGGEPRQFLRREQFCSALSDATGVSEDGAYAAWIGLGGAPKPVEKKKESKGFFAAFADTLKENAAGVKDTRPKDKWGDTINEMTIIDVKIILESEAGAAGFSEAAVAKLLDEGA